MSELENHLTSESVDRLYDAFVNGILTLESRETTEGIRNGKVHLGVLLDARTGENT